MLCSLMLDPCIWVLLGVHQTVLLVNPTLIMKSQKYPCYFLKKSGAPNDPFFFLIRSFSSSLFREPFFFSFLPRASSFLSSAGSPFFLLPHCFASPFASPTRGGCSSSMQAAASPSFECASSSVLSRGAALLFFIEVRFMSLLLFVIAFIVASIGDCLSI